jgi:hypothetical protein
MILNALLKVIEKNPALVEDLVEKLIKLIVKKLADKTAS